MSNKTLVIIRGIVGSGKTTLAKKVIEQWSCFANHLETDFYFHDLTTQEYKFDASKLGEHHENCLRETARLMSLGGAIVVSNTFTRQWEMHKYLLLAEVFDYEVVVHTCTGNYENVHGVPAEVVERQAARLEYVDNFKGEYPNVNWGRHLFQLIEALDMDANENTLVDFEPLDYLNTEEACAAYLESAEDTGDDLFIDYAKETVKRARASL